MRREGEEDPPVKKRRNLVALLVSKECRRECLLANALVAVY